jgi:hypothetical protein
MDQADIQAELRRKMVEAFEVYNQEVQGLRMYLLTLQNEPSAEDVGYIEVRKAAIRVAFAMYDRQKARYVSALLNVKESS